MRIRDIEIKHFLCFRHLQLPVTNPMQLIAGPNNAGKSSLLRLLDAYFSGASAAEFAALQPRNAYYTDLNQLGRRALSQIRITFEPEDDAEREAFDDLLVKGRFWVSVVKGRAGQFEYRASKTKSSARAKQAYDEVLKKVHFVVVPSVRIGGPEDNAHPAAFERLFRTLEGVLVRKGKSRKTKLQKQFEGHSGTLSQSVEKTLGLAAKTIEAELPLDGESISFDLGGPAAILSGIMRSISISSEDGDTNLPLEDRGTGYQSVLVLGVLRYVAQMEAARGTSVIFGIEEPEAFLHPQLQRAVAMSLARLSRSAQLIVTTHSPVIVDANSIDALVRLPLQREGVSFSWTPVDLGPSRQGRLSRVCNATNSELVFANRVIIVEGESDKLFIEYLLDRVLDASSSHSAGISVIDAGGAGVIPDVLRLARRFEVPAVAIVDMDVLDKSGGRTRHIDRLVEDGFDIPIEQSFHEYLREVASRPAPTYQVARSTQRELLAQLHNEPRADVFVLSSDLEGLLGSLVDPGVLADVLGPDGLDHWSSDLAKEIRSEPAGANRTLLRLGSKGLERKNKNKELKLKPHMIVPIVEAAGDAFFGHPEVRALASFAIGRPLKRKVRPTTTSRIRR